jgi:hypothetical protein
MDAELPKDLPEFRQGDQPSKFDNMLALIHLTGGLGDIATALYAPPIFLSHYNAELIITAGHSSSDAPKTYRRRTLREYC